MTVEGTDRPPQETMASERPHRIVSWNVNGIRAVAKKGFRDWLDSSGAEIVGLQEVRASHDQIPPDVHGLDGWHYHWVCAERAGYSGVGLMARRPHDEVRCTLGVRTLDCEGRLVMARFGALTVVNGYFPNGNGPDRDNSRIPFKLRFYKKLFEVIEAEKARGARILVMGDFNTAHEEIDIARPKENRETSGFTAIERKEMSRWLAKGWVDTFRHFEKGAGHYTWWSQRFGVREKNIGWRIDYVLASPAAMEFVRGAAIHPEIKGSDHCPISVDVDDAIFRGSP